MKNVLLRILISVNELFILYLFSEIRQYKFVVDDLPAKGLDNHGDAILSGVPKHTRGPRIYNIIGIQYPEFPFPRGPQSFMTPVPLSLEWDPD